MPKLNRRPRCYVAGPYTKPDPCINTNRAIYIANRLWYLGFAPYVPHLTHLWNTVTPKPYIFWLEYDAEFIPVMDCVYRFDGESTGADREVKQAISLGIPIFHTIEAMCEHFELTPDH